MSLLSSIAEDRFWDDWNERFESNANKYIKPDDKMVESVANSIDLEGASSEYEIAVEAWDFVDKNVDYRLSKKWKTPRETLTSGIGDCEDRVFLLGSILPNLGVEQFEVVVGEAVVGNEGEFHNWMRVNGKVVDPTTPVGTTDEIGYVEENSFTINTEA